MAKTKDAMRRNGGGAGSEQSRTTTQAPVERLASDIVPESGLAEEFNSDRATQASAQALYDNDRTMAFPSTASVVKRVPPLAQMEKSMKEAPVGTTVAGRFRRGNGEEEIRVMRKTSDTTWETTDLTPDSAGNGMYGRYRPAKYKGIKALQQMQYILNEGLRSQIPHGASMSYEEGR